MSSEAPTRERSTRRSRMLRQAATTVEDGPMRSVAIAPLAATAPGADAIVAR